MIRARVKFFFIFVFIFSFTIILPAQAQTKVDKMALAEVKSEQVIEGNYYALASTIDIQGTIKGDLICLGDTVNITGAVEGDIICAGKDINIQAPVGGNIRIFGDKIKIASKVRRNITAFGNNIFLDKTSQIGWNVLVWADKAELYGTIKGTLQSYGQKLVLNAEVDKDVDAKVDKLVIGQEARIKQNLNYVFSGQKPVISPQAVISGKIKKKEAPVKKNNLNLILNSLWVNIIALFGTLVLGLLLISCSKKNIVAIAQEALEKPWAYLGWGLLLLIVTPFPVILLAITIIGFPAAIVFALVWIIALLLAKEMTAIILGYWIFVAFKKKAKNILQIMVIGTICLYLLLSLPIFGFWLNVLAIIFGLGGVWFYFKKLF